MTHTAPFVLAIAFALQIAFPLSAAALSFAVDGQSEPTSHPGVRVLLTDGSDNAAGTPYTVPGVTISGTGDTEQLTITSLSAQLVGALPAPQTLTLGPSNEIDYFGRVTENPPAECFGPFPPATGCETSTTTTLLGSYAIEHDITFSVELGDLSETRMPINNAGLTKWRAFLQVRIDIESRIYRDGLLDSTFLYGLQKAVIGEFYFSCGGTAEDPGCAANFRSRGLQNEIGGPRPTIDPSGYDSITSTRLPGLSIVPEPNTGLLLGLGLTGLAARSRLRDARR